MKPYELTYLITPELEEEEVKQIQDKVTSLAQEEGGLLIEGSAGRAVKKKLAYPINKKTQAYLAVLKFQLSPAKIGNIKNKIKEEKQILRSLVVIKELPKKKPEKSRPSGTKTEKPRSSGAQKEKVEIKEIDKKLDEILDEPE